MSQLAYRPQYRQIEQALRERIAGLRAGERLPSDAELMAEFGVSRMTARNAMQRLAEDGLLRREPGRGSFVSQPSAHRRTNRLMTFTREMLRAGRQPSSRVLIAVVRPATVAEAEALGLAPREPVFHLRRLRLADDQPIVLESAILVVDTAPAIFAGDVERGSLHETLTRAGFVLRRGTGTIGADRATAEDARLLGLRVGDPLLVERRTIADDDGRRLEATESRYAGDRYALEVQFEVESPDEPAGE
ncbi:MAG TPA: GntR family transcriptional regulator [Candidatus Limnocylindrales bacterium]|jgi:GntR family transcriptional regulator|nr:GntR family transcriptional regulator [Candidatus Limnocylindrales bacterium]